MTFACDSVFILIHLNGSSPSRRLVNFLHVLSSKAYSSSSPSALNSPRLRIAWGLRSVWPDCASWIVNIYATLSIINLSVCLPQTRINQYLHFYIFHPVRLSPRFDFWHVPKTGASSSSNWTEIWLLFYFRPLFFILSLPNFCFVSIWCLLLICLTNCYFLNVDQNKWARPEKCLRSGFKVKPTLAACQLWLKIFEFDRYVFDIQ